MTRSMRLASGWTTVAVMPWHEWLLILVLSFVVIYFIVWLWAMES